MGTSHSGKCLPNQDTKSKNYKGKYREGKMHEQFKTSIWQKKKKKTQKINWGSACNTWEKVNIFNSIFFPINPLKRQSDNQRITYEEMLLNLTEN